MTLHEMLIECTSCPFNQRIFLVNDCGSEWAVATGGTFTAMSSGIILDAFPFPACPSQEKGSDTGEFETQLYHGVAVHTLVSYITFLSLSSLSLQWA